MSSRSYILQIMLWHQSLKSIHYRTLCIFQNKKNPTDLRVMKFLIGGHDLAVRGVSKYKVDMNFIIFREFNTMLEMVDS